jgi:uncharacterized protein (DUF1330 family)
MKIHCTIAIATLAGVAIGAFGVQGLQAQSTPKAYVISEITIIDQAAQEAYLPKVSEAIKSSGGTFIARGGRIVALEGETPKRVTVVAYDSLEKAQAARTSASWKALQAERDKAIKVRAYIVEGLPN